MAYTPDPKSMAGKELPIEERTDLLVIGAGPAGLACALAAAAQGRAVVLVDENPVSAATMGEDSRPTSAIYFLLGVAGVGLGGMILLVGLAFLSLALVAWH